MRGTDIEYEERQENGMKLPEEDTMNFREKWDAIWMAITFAEANEPDTAAAIYKETRKRAEKRVSERPVKRPRQRL